MDEQNTVEMDPVAENGVVPDTPPTEPLDLTSDERRFISALLQTPEVCALLTEPGVKALASNVQVKLG